jgi:DNA polymerase III epsilon subunit
MNKEIDEIELTIFDTETTGLSPQAGDRIVEIAGMRFKGVSLIDTFQTLVNPDREISAGAFRVNQISQEMLKNAPGMGKVAAEFMEFIKGSCLCSYNAGFDLEFLQNELRLLNQDLDKTIMVLDVLKMARRLLPGLDRYALWFVAEHLGIKGKQEHRAFSDVELTFAVFQKLKSKLKSQGVMDYRHYASLFSVNKHFLGNELAQKLSQIQEAIDLGAGLKMRYLSVSTAEVTLREVMPKEIRRENQHNYLVGFCSLKNDERTFRIDNILEIEIV